MLEASRFPDGSVRNMKLRVVRPEAPGFSGSPSDVASGDLTVSLTAKKGAPPRFSVSARAQFKLGDTGAWNSYRGLSPVGMGGSTDFHAAGATWTEMTAQATELDGAPAWNWTNGQTSSVAGGMDAVQVERVLGSLGAVLPR